MEGVPETSSTWATFINWRMNPSGQVSQGALNIRGVVVTLLSAGTSCQQHQELSLGQSNTTTSMPMALPMISPMTVRSFVGFFCASFVWVYKKCKGLICDRIWENQPLCHV